MTVNQNSIGSTHHDLRKFPTAVRDDVGFAHAIEDSEMVEQSRGNVFADLEVEDADEMLAKAKLSLAILEVIERRGLKQSEAAKILGTDQSYISKLKRGSELRRFTFDRLMSWLTKLDRNVILMVEQKPQNQEAGMIQVAGI